MHWETQDALQAGGLYEPRRLRRKRKPLMLATKAASCGNLFNSTRNISSANDAINLAADAAQGKTCREIETYDRP